ncbi:MAG: hypothetical protein WC566_07565 [Dehalococcoidia bacterium]
MLLAIPLIIAAGILAWVTRPKEKQTGPARLSILATIILPCLIALAAIASQLISNAIGMTGILGLSNTLFIIGLCLIGIAILALVVFAAKRKGDVVKGIGFGICISVIVYTLAFGLLEWLAGL